MADCYAWGLAVEAFTTQFERPRTVKKKEFAVAGFSKSMREDARRLIGREEEVRLVQASVEGLHRGAFLVEGPAGIGKSALLGAASVALSSSEDRLVVPFRFAAGDARCNREDFLLHALERLRDFRDNGLKETGAGTTSEVASSLRELLASELGARVIFVVDGLDEIAARDPRFVDEVLVPLTSAGGRWLCSTRPMPGIGDRLRESGAKAVFEHGLAGLSSDGIRRMFLEGLSRVPRKKLVRLDRDVEGGVRNSFVERVVERAQGLPLYVVFIIKEIEADRIRSLEDLDALPQSISAYYETVLARAGVSSVQQVATPLLAHLTVALRPMGAHALYALLRDRRLVPAGQAGLDLTWQGLAQIASVLRPADGNGWTLVHASLREHLSRSPGFRFALATAREVVADFAESFGQEPQRGRRPASSFGKAEDGLRSELDGQATRALTRALAKDAFEYLEADGRRESARNLLRNLEYQMDLVGVDGADGVQALARAWARVRHEVLTTEPLQQWERFWRAHEHLLLRNRGRGAQQALLQRAWQWGRKTDVTRQAEAWVAAHGRQRPWLRVCEDDRPEAPAHAPIQRVIEKRTRHLAFGPDGRELAFGDEQGWLFVLRLVDGQLRRHRVQGAPIRGLAMIPIDGDALVVSSTEGGRVRAHRLSDFAQVFEITLETEVDAICVTPDGRFLALEVPEELVRIVDARSGAPHGTLRAATVAAGFRGSELLALVEENLQLIDAETQQVRAERPGSGFICCALPVGRRAVTLSLQSVQIIDFDGEGRSFEGIGALRRPVVPSRDGRYLFAEGARWDLQTGRRVPAGLHGTATCAALAPDGSTIAFGGPELRLHEYASWQPPNTTVVPEGVVLTPDRRTAIVRDSAGQVAVWSLETRERMHVLAGPRGGAEALSVIGGRIAVINASEVSFFALASGAHRGDWCPESMAHVRAVGESADGRRIVAVTTRAVHEWDLETEREVTSTRLGTDAEYAALAVVSPDGRRALLVMSDGETYDTTSLVVWDLETRAPILKVPFAQPSSVIGVAADFAGGLAVVWLMEDVAIEVGLDDGAERRRISMDALPHVAPQLWAMLHPERVYRDVVVDHPARLLAPRRLEWFADEAVLPMVGPCGFNVFELCGDEWKLRKLELVDEGRVVAVATPIDPSMN